MNILFHTLLCRTRCTHLIKSAARFNLNNSESCVSFPGIVHLMLWQCLNIILSFWLGHHNGGSLLLWVKVVHCVWNLCGAVLLPRHNIHLLLMKLWLMSLSPAVRTSHYNPIIVCASLWTACTHHQDQYALTLTSQPDSRWAPKDFRLHLALIYVPKNIKDMDGWIKDMDGVFCPYFKFRACLSLQISWRITNMDQRQQYHQKPMGAVLSKQANSESQSGKTQRGRKF